jgi:hypothetical protein
MSSLAPLRRERSIAASAQLVGGRATSPPADHLAQPRKSTSPERRTAGPGYADVLSYHNCAHGGIRTHGLMLRSCKRPGAVRRDIAAGQ